ncbi:hypothetical protein [Pseudonocardia parietis]|uniref:Peptide zinc metalloprotease protein n=1 Tax=Pseudonocardia parietis TaxID=570936 RepID=A0ABS4W465_9PSEU|nr:hypothetical protein [Pseudonocardia parietis]MBP2370971.1 putative peptide zinc metalloprotease protein [Pseudonocardia parietis]
MQTLVLDPPTELVAAPFRRAAGVELVGPYQGSGYTTQRYVIVRGDGQVVQVSEVLFRIASAIDGRSGPAELARRVGEETGENLAAGDIDALVRERLVPVGLVESGAGDPDPVAADQAHQQRPDHLLMLKFRLPVVPPAGTWAIAGLFSWLHRRAIVVPVLAAVVVLDLMVLFGGGAAGALAGAGSLVTNPALVLAVLGLFLAAGAFHEAGHVSACRFGGARPGAMGVGIYLVWPAFYSTVTDSYRLSRAGRLRTDLGGVYFNAIVLGGLGASWLLTGADWLLVVLALLHVETVRQFVPMIRLDGYYILSDLVGVPDLFSYLGPVLRSRLPGATPDPKLAQLRPGVRRTVELWVALVVPFLVLFLGGFLLAAPVVVPEMLAGVAGHLADSAAGVRAGTTAEAVLGAARAALLALPVAGGALLLGLVAKRLSEPLVRRLVETRATAGRGGPTLVGALLPVALIGALTVAGADGIPAAVRSMDPLGLGERQLTALAALIGAPVPAALTGAPVPTALTGAPGAAIGVLLGAVGAVLLWPMARRIGLPFPVAGLAVVLAGAVPPLVMLQASADPAAPAAFWLLVAALLAGRGPAAARGAYLACALAALTSPVAAVALAAFVAHAAGTGQLGPRLRPAGRWVVVVAATVLAALGGGMLLGLGGVLPDADPVPVALAAAGGLLVLLTARLRRPLAPVGTAAAALLVLAQFPDTRTAALLLLGPVLAMLGAGLADRVLDRARPARAGAVLAVTVLVLVAASGPVVKAAADAAAPRPPAVAADAGVPDVLGIGD